HDQYKLMYRALRDGEINGLMKEMRDLNGGGMMPKREVVEGFIKKMDALNTKVAALDNQMFDAWQPLLTEGQAAMPPRIRQARQRQRYNSQQMMTVNGERSVDLSEIMFKLDLTAEQRQNTDATLAVYESKLTTSLSKLYEANSKMMLSM